MNTEIARKVGNIMKDRNYLFGLIPRITNGADVKIPNSIQNQVIEIIKEKLKEIDKQIEEM